jgi:hypothetical protein
VDELERNALRVRGVSEPPQAFLPLQDRGGVQRGP